MTTEKERAWMRFLEVVGSLRGGTFSCPRPDASQIRSSLFGVVQPFQATYIRNPCAEIPLRPPASPCHLGAPHIWHVLGGDMHALVVGSDLSYLLFDSLDMPENVSVKELHPSQEKNVFALIQMDHDSLGATTLAEYIEAFAAQLGHPETFVLYVFK